MTIDQRTLLFFDASCLIAAAGSPTGGSGFLLSLCARKWVRGAISHLVLLEAEHNIEAKLGPEVMNQYHTLLQIVPLLVAPVPLVSPHTSWLQKINDKDVHVVAAVLAVNAPYLLTLDQKLVAQVNHASLPIHALAPGDFIRTVLPYHIDYPALR